MSSTLAEPITNYPYVKKFTIFIKIPNIKSVQIGINSAVTSNNLQDGHIVRITVYLQFYLNHKIRLNKINIRLLSIDIKLKIIIQAI